MGDDGEALFTPQRQMVDELLEWFDDVASGGVGNLALDLPGARGSGRSTVLTHLRLALDRRATASTTRLPSDPPPHLCVHLAPIVDDPLDRRLLEQLSDELEPLTSEAWVPSSLVGGVSLEESLHALELTRPRTALELGAMALGMLVAGPAATGAAVLGAAMFAHDRLAARRRFVDGGALGIDGLDVDERMPIVAAALARLSELTPILLTIDDIDCCGPAVDSLVAGLMHRTSGRVLIVATRPVDGPRPFDALRSDPSTASRVHGLNPLRTAEPSIVATELSLQIDTSAALVERMVPLVRDWAALDQALHLAHVTDPSDGELDALLHPPVTYPTDEAGVALAALAYLGGMRFSTAELREVCAVIGTDPTSALGSGAAWLRAVSPEIIEFSSAVRRDTAHGRAQVLRTDQIQEIRARLDALTAEACAASDITSARLVVLTNGARHRTHDSELSAAASWALADAFASFGDQHTALGWADHAAALAPISDIQQARIATWRVAVGQTDAESLIDVVATAEDPLELIEASLVAATGVGPGTPDGRALLQRASRTATGLAGVPEYLIVALARLWIESGDLVEAVAALAHLPETGPWGSLRGPIQDLLQSRADVRFAFRMAENVAALQWARATDPTGSVVQELLIDQANLCVDLGRPIPATNAANEVLERNDWCPPLGPSARATALVALGRAMLGAGEPTSALAALRQVTRLVAKRDPLYSTSRFYASEAARSLGDASAALAEIEEVIRAKTDHPDLGPDHPDTLASRASRAEALHDLGHTQEALTEIDAVIAAEANHPDIGPDHPRTLASRGCRAGFLFALGRTEDALVEADRIILARDSHPSLGPNHPETLAGRGNRAHYLTHLGRNAEALTELDAVIAAVTSHPDIGPNHPYTLGGRHGRAISLQSLGRTTEALTEIDAVIAAESNHPDIGPNHPSTLASRHCRATFLHDLDQTQHALTEIDAVIAAESNHPDIGPNHPSTLASRHCRARFLHDLGQTQQALTEINAVTAARTAHPDIGPNHPDTLASVALRDRILEDPSAAGD